MAPSLESRTTSSLLNGVRYQPSGPISLPPDRRHRFQDLVPLRMRLWRNVPQIVHRQHGGGSVPPQVRPLENAHAAGAEVVREADRPKHLFRTGVAVEDRVDGASCRSRSKHLVRERAERRSPLSLLLRRPKRCAVPLRVTRRAKRP